MNRKTFPMAILAAAVVAAPLIAQADYTIPSRCEANLAISAKDSTIGMCSAEFSKDGCEQHPSCWWRDTTFQNSLWAHSRTQYPSAIVTAYMSATVKVLVFAGRTGTNVVALVGPLGNVIVGTGGSRSAARLALQAFSTHPGAPPCLVTNVAGLFYLSPYPESYFGAAEWINPTVGSCTAPTDPHIIAHASFLDQMARFQAVSTEMIHRRLRAYGPMLTYGPNGNLGTGWAFGYNPYQPNSGAVPPNETVATEQTVYYGNIPITILPTPIEGDIMLWLPGSRILIAGTLGKFMPEFGGITRHGNHVAKWISKLDSMVQLEPNVLVPLNGLPVIGAAEVTKFLSDQKAALASVHAQTVSSINGGVSLDDIVATVAVPEPLASQPSVQPFATSVSEVVRGIYHDYLGWFDGNPANLESLSAAEMAGRMMDFGGGEGSVLDYCKKLLRAHTREDTKMALNLLTMHRRAYPANADAAHMYIETLRMLGYSAKSAELRNYYLTIAQEAAPTAP